MERTNDNLQRDFFEALKIKIPEEEKFVYVLADLLNVSIDAAYRRIRGQKELSFSELAFLCGHYNISFDLFLGVKTNQVTFHYRSLEQQFDENYKIYLSDLRSSLKLLLQGKKQRIIFAATDIPVVHLVDYPELIAFKVHTWRKKDKSCSYDNHFDPASILDDETLALYKDISDYYKRVPSVEIWTNYTIDHTLRLIEYFLELGDFASAELPLLLCDQLQEMMEYLHLLSLKGNSSDFSHFSNLKMYLSELLHENNFVYFESEGNKGVYLKMHTINSIVTHDSELCGDIKLWLDDVMSKSTLLTGSSQKQCSQFFRYSFQQIADLRSRVNRYSY